MTRYKQPKFSFSIGLLAVVVTMVAGGMATDLCDAQPVSTASPESTNAPSAQSPDPGEITGAELYSIHCNRCHPDRYPTERTAANWKTIMLHMQVRANLPVAQSRLILKYLQDNSGR